METAQEPVYTLRLKNRSEVPSFGWLFEEERTQTPIIGHSFDDLVARVLDHRIANNLPIGTWKDTEIEVEAQLCTKLRPGACRQKVLKRGTARATARAVGWHDVANFLTVALKWLRMGLKPVSQEEADRRARICAGCEFNVQAQGCPGCKARDFAANLSMAKLKRETPYDDQLKACAVCGCANKAQVHYPLEALHKGVTADMVFPEWCWKRKTATPA